MCFEFKIPYYSLYTYTYIIGLPIKIEIPQHNLEIFWINFFFCKKNIFDRRKIRNDRRFMIEEFFFDFDIVNCSYFGKGK